MPRVRKSKKDKDEEKSISLLLPPCLVCSGKASGLHFGVNTCEACKAFFRRCLHRDKDAPLICPAEKKCTIYFQNKYLCPYCRFQKCLKVGMSKDAIKTGRYTLEHKAGLLKNAGTRVIGTVSAPPDYRGAISPSHQPFDAEATTSNSNHSNGSAPHDSQIPENPLPIYPIGPNIEELEEMTSIILEAFQIFSPYTEEMKARIPKEQSEYQGQKDLIEELFGPMQPLTREEYLEIYKTTGIDIDGRMERARGILPTIKKSITSMVKFARYIPGFTEIPIEDQVILVEGCGFEWWVVNAVIGVNVTGGLFTSFFGITHTKDEMISHQHPCDNSDKTVDVFFKMAAILQDLKTDSTTDALLCAICTTNTDSRTISCQEKMEEIQYKMIEALSLHLSRTRHQPLRVLHKLLNVSNELRSCRPHDVLGRLENGQYASHMGAHMAPIIHALLCERPPSCKRCGVMPCPAHEHYHPRNLPTFKNPPPLRGKCNRNAPNLVHLAMTWNGHRPICPDVEYTEGMKLVKEEQMSMPIDYSSAKPDIMSCGILQGCMSSENPNVPVDYSSCDMRSDSPSCCPSVSSDSTECTSAELNGAFELDRESQEYLENSLVSGHGSGHGGKGKGNYQMNGNQTPTPIMNRQGGCLDKWQALQKVCQHFIDEYDNENNNSDIAGKIMKVPMDGNENQMDIDDSPNETSPHQLNQVYRGGKNIDELYKSGTQMSSPDHPNHPNHPDQTNVPTNHYTVHNGKNETMMRQMRPPGMPSGKLPGKLAYKQQQLQQQQQQDLTNQSWSDERLQQESNSELDNMQVQEEPTMTQLVTARQNSYKGKNIQEILEQRRSQTDCHSTPN